MKCIIFFATFFLSLIDASPVFAQMNCFPKGTRWTEIQLDTLLYKEWYSKIKTNKGIHYTPNFKVVEYHVEEKFEGKAEYIGNDELYAVYANTENQQDSFVCYAEYEPTSEYNSADFCILLKYGSPVDGFDKYATPSTHLNYTNWSDESEKIGKDMFYCDLTTAQITGYRWKSYGIIQKKDEAYFGGVHPITFIDTDKGVRILENIGVTAWNEGECILGPAKIYETTVTDFMPGMKDFILNTRHHRSMLVRFERNGELLYNVWPNENGEPIVVGLENIPAHTPQIKELYDIHGRKLNDRPMKGLYIENKKIKLKR